MKLMSSTDWRFQQVDYGKKSMALTENKNENMEMKVNYNELVWLMTLFMVNLQMNSLMDSLQMHSFSFFAKIILLQRTWYVSTGA